MIWPKVTIIFPNFNGGQNPLECLSSIKKLNYPQNRLEIIIVDNNSQDGSPVKIKKEFPKTIILCQKRNLGFAKAVNLAAKKAVGKFLFITNDDITFEKESLINLVEYTINHTKTGIVGGKQINPKTGKFLAGGRKFNFLTGRQSPVKSNKPVECDQVDGCCILTSKEIFNKVGLFDEGFFPAYGEDLDFCLKVKKANYKVIYNPQAIFYHKFGQTVSKFPLTDMYYFGFKNKLRLILKHANFFQITAFLFTNYFLTVPARIVIKREPILIPEIKALVWNIKNLKKTLMVREEK